MADIIEILRQKYLKEQREYQDAVAAYEQMLNRVASSMPIPVAMQSNYSVASGGYLRAATDPWVLKKHPELAPLANNLGKEKGEYDQALDDYSAYVANNKCGAGTYIADRFYEYAALGEMVYMLATDEEFRKKVLANLGAAIDEGGTVGDFFLTFQNGKAKEANAFSGGNPEAIAGNEAMIAATEPAVGRLTNRVKGFFISRWNAFLQGWEECGLASAVQRAGIDGLFLVGEVIVTGLAIKGVKLSYNLTKDGLHRVEILSVDTGRSVGERSWSGGALDAKYKAANDNHVGGMLEDRNQKIPDEPAEKVEQRKREERKTDEWPDGSYRDTSDLPGMRRASDGTAMIKDRDDTWTRVDQIPPHSNPYKGQWGEAMADRRAGADNWEKINGPDTPIEGKLTHGKNGIDGIYRNVDGKKPKYFVTDSKTGDATLRDTKSGVQLSDQWIRQHLQKMVSRGEISKKTMDEVLRSYKPLIQKVDNKGNIQLLSTDGQIWRGDQE